MNRHIRNVYIRVHADIHKQAFLGFVRHHNESSDASRLPVVHPYLYRTAISTPFSPARKPVRPPDAALFMCQNTCGTDTRPGLTDAGSHLRRKVKTSAIRGLRASPTRMRASGRDPEKCSRLNNPQRVFCKCALSRPPAKSVDNALMPPVIIFNSLSMRCSAGTGQSTV